METQFKKGFLEAYVLAVLKKEDAYGYSLLEEITKVFDISESTLYPILRRLETAGYLSTYKLEYSGRLRKYYRLTAQGVLRLEDYKKQCYSIKKIIERIFGY